jgi:hypothetical protein
MPSKKPKGPMYVRKPEVASDVTRWRRLGLVQRLGSNASEREALRRELTHNISARGVITDRAIVSERYARSVIANGGKTVSAFDEEEE